MLVFAIEVRAYDSVTIVPFIADGLKGWSGLVCLCVFSGGYIADTGAESGDGGAYSHSADRWVKLKQ